MQPKDLLFSLAFLFVLVFAGNEVVTAQVSSQRMDMSRGTNEALILELPTADRKMVGKLWPDWLKDNYRVKSKKVKKSRIDEMMHLDFSIPGVSTGSNIDMYSAVRSSGGGSELTVWIATPDGYVSPDLGSARYVEAEKMLMRFALAVGRAQIEREIEDQEKELKQLEKDLDKLRRNREGFEKDIANAERAIEEAKQNIEGNLGDQENKNREIEAQIEKIENTKRRLKDF